MTLKHLLASAVLALGMTGAAASGHHAYGQGGGTLTVALPADPVTLDPAFIGDIPSSIVSHNIHEMLVMRDEEMNFIPGLAISWEVAEDERTWTFRLREGVTFHDGTPFTAEAVVFTFDRLIDPEVGSPRGSMVAPFESIEAIDDLTVRIVTREVYAPMLAQISSKYLAIVSPGAPDTGRTYGTAPVGTGPFRLESILPGEHVILQRFDEYWGDPVVLDRVLFQTVPEPSTRVLQLLSGEVDVVTNAPPVLLPRLVETGAVRVEQRTGYRTIYLGLNNTMEPFDDIRVRQAVAHAIDIAAIHAGVLSGVGSLGGSFESNAVSGSNTELPHYPFDPDRSRALLAEAGFPDGFSTTFYTPVGRYTVDRQVAEAIQAQLADVGIRASIQAPEFGALQDLLRVNTQVPMFLMGKGSPSGDLDLSMNMSMRTGTPFNHFNYSSERVDALIDEQASIVDLERRYEVLAELQRQIYEDYPVIVLFYEDQLIAMRSGVQGVEIFPDEVIGFGRARID